MQCRPHCGACCVAPAITRPFWGMPGGKAAGERCVHLTVQRTCRLFGDPRRPKTCIDFLPEPATCGSTRSEALELLDALERETAEAIA